MNFKSSEAPVEYSASLEVLRNALEKISHQLHQVLCMSGAVVLNLEVRAEHADAIEAMELELRKSAILDDMTSTEQAIDCMNREIAELLRVGWRLSQSTGSREENVLPLDSSVALER